MKKYFIPLLLCFALIITACSGGEQEESESSSKQKENKNIEMKSAKEFLDNYMRYVVKMETDVMKSFYSEKLKQQIQDIPQASNPHPVGYSIGEGEGKSGTAEYSVNIFNASTASPYFSTDTYKYTVIMEDGKMLIDNIKKDKTMEVSGKGKILYMREGSKVEGKYVISLDDLPSYASPQASPEMKLAVPKESLGPCGLSPDNKTLVISSIGKDSFLAQGEIEEEEQSAMTQMAQGGEEKEAKQGGGSEEEQGGKEGGGEGQKEQGEKAKIKLNPIDLYVNTKITAIVFSPDGKTIAVEVIPQGEKNQLRLYKADKGEIIQIDKINNNFRSDRFSLEQPYFVSPTSLNFTVKAVEGAVEEEKDLEGDWSYDIEKEVLKQSK